MFFFLTQENPDQILDKKDIPSDKNHDTDAVILILSHYMFWNGP